MKIKSILNLLIGLAMLWLGGKIISSATPPDFYVPWVLVYGSGLTGIVLVFAGFLSLRGGDSNPNPLPGKAVAGTGNRTHTRVIQRADVNVSQGYNPFTNENSKRLSADVGRWSIGVNRFGGDNQAVQVFIVDMMSDNDWSASIPMTEVTKFISDKTGLNAEQIRNML